MEEIREMPTMSAEDQLITFVNEKIEYMKQYLRLGADKEINFYELENALKEYQNVYLSLISMQNIARIKYKIEEERFTTWFASKFLTIRSEVNRPELTAQKWAGQKELEYMVRKDYAEEYEKKKEHLLAVEMEKQTMDDIVDSWKSYQFVLNALCNNIRAEVSMQGVASKL